MSQLTSRAALLAFIGGDAQLASVYEQVREVMDDDPGHDVSHVLRVALWTIRIGGDEVDPREAAAAALLHDIVNVPKDHPDRARASELCADHARDLLVDHGFSADAVARIHAAIRDHSFSRGATPTAPLGRALQDADRLEALGAIGVFRTISTGSRMGARYFHDDDPWALGPRDRDDVSYSIDHFFKKLLGLHKTMLTPRGRAEACRRTAFLVATLRQLGEELGVPVPDSLLGDVG